MNRLLKFAASLCVIAYAWLGTGCAAKRPVHVAHVPYRAHFDPTHCHYLPDGIRFKCHDVVFDPQEIDATGKK